MTEQPSEAKHLKLHRKAMQVFPKWVDDLSISLTMKGCFNVNQRASAVVSALRELDARFKAAFQEDEQVRANLLAACEAALIEIDAAVASGEVVSSSLRRRLEVAIVNAKETDR